MNARGESCYIHYTDISSPADFCSRSGGVAESGEHAGAASNSRNSSTLERASYLRGVVAWRWAATAATADGGPLRDI